MSTQSHGFLLDLHERLPPDNVAVAAIYSHEHIARQENAHMLRCACCTREATRKVTFTSVTLLPVIYDLCPEHYQAGLRFFASLLLEERP